MIRQHLRADPKTPSGLQHHGLYADPGPFRGARCGDERACRGAGIPHEHGLGAHGDVSVHARYLRVIGKRPDGYHEIRTVFQTISLSDRLDLAFTPQRSTQLELTGNVDIPDNLVTRAARLCLDEMRLTGRLAVSLLA